MKEITFVTGDATAPSGDGPRIIAHVCTDAGGRGKGFVVAISRRWPAPEKAYRQWYRDRASNDFALGAVQVVPVAANLWVANMIGQHGYHRKSGAPPVRYEAIDACLATLGAYALEHHASVHMPRISCGLAGGTWDRIEPMIRRNFAERDITVTVYDFGAMPTGV